MLRPDLERGLMIATILTAINLGIGFVVTVISQELYMSTISGGGAFLEIAFLLIIGGCLMSRQPLEDKDRFEADGSYTKSWRTALYGRQMLLAAVILFFYLIVLSLVAYFVPF